MRSSVLVGPQCGRSGGAAASAAGIAAVEVVMVTSANRGGPDRMQQPGPGNRKRGKLGGVVAALIVLGVILGLALSCGHHGGGGGY
jgi:hypothetical protein